MATELSERQQKILDFIQEFIHERHFPPSIREIGGKVGISSTSVVKYNLDALEKKGFIERAGDISRGIRLVEEAARRFSDVIQVPLYLPLSLDGVPDSSDSPIFFGAVNIYLQEKNFIFRKTPRFIDGILDTPALLRWAANKAKSTSARGLEEMTLSMLRGGEGRQAKEVDRLLRWLEAEGPPTWSTCPTRSSWDWPSP